MEWRRRALLTGAIIGLGMVSARAGAEEHDDLELRGSAAKDEAQSTNESDAEGTGEADSPNRDPEAPPVSLPEALDIPVTYPEGAEGEAEVTLELVIDTDGAVQAASVVEGPTPFAEHAREAALAWQFQPATKNGQPTAAKIRFLVRFEPPEEPTPEEEPVEAPPEAAPPGREPEAPALPAGPQPTFQVTVRGERRAPGATTIGRAEAQQLPGAFGDPLRAIEAMPGVTPVASGVPFFFVRGAPPGNLGFFIDGVPVPLLYHAFIGPAAFHPRLIDSVELHRGGYPARLGRFAGGIVTASLEPPPERFTGQASLRVIDSGAYLASPFDEGRGYAVAAGRYSYTALVLSLISDAVLEYWDYQARAGYNLTDKDSISIFGFGAHDFASDEDQESFAGVDFHRIDVRYDRRFAESSRARLAFTAGYDRSRATNGTVSGRTYRLRTEIDHRASDEVQLFVGADANVERFDLELTRDANPDIEELFPPRDELVFGTYADLLLTPEPWMTVEPGLRVDVYRSLGNTEVGVDPRVSASFSVTDDTRLIHSLGLVHQAPNFVPSLPGARVGGLRGGLQRALQSSAGVEQDLPQDFTASVTLFHNLFFNLSDPLGFSRKIAADVDAADVRALGTAVGAELLVRRDLTRRLGGFLSYTLSRSVRSRGRLEPLSAFDRTHVATAALSYDLGKRWKAGARTQIVSGVPVRELTGEGPRFVGDNRAPAFARLDLRLEKRWIVNERLWWAFIAEVLNATAAQEIIGRSCNEIRCTDSPVGPLVLPSVGVEVGF